MPKLAHHSAQLLLTVATVGVLASVAVAPASAQRGGGFPGGLFGGPRGGFGPGGPGAGGLPPGAALLRTLRVEGVVDELGLSQEQQDGLADVAARAQPDRTVMFEAFGRMRSAASDEERAAIRAEIAESMRAPIEAAVEDARGILSESQFARLGQLRRQQAGPRLLDDDEVATELGLSDAQRDEVTAVLEEAADDGFDRRNATEEQITARREALDGGLLGVLTDAQRSAWEASLGEPSPAIAADTGVPRGRRDGPRRTDDEAAPPAVADAAGPDDGPAVETAAAETPTADEAVAGLLELLGPEDSGPGGPVVSDFGGEGLAGVVGDGGATTLTFNFRNAPWDDVLSLFAKAAGLTLDLENVPPGSFSYLDEKSYTPGEALDVLNGYLLQRGYALFRRDRFLVAVDLRDGVPSALVPTVEAASLAGQPRNRFVRVMLPTGAVAAEDFVDDAKELLSPYGVVVSLGNSNRIVVTDVAGNVAEIAAYVSEAVRPPEPYELTFAAFKLRHAAAADLEPIVRELLGIETEDQTGGSSSRGNIDPRRAMEFMQRMMGGRGGGRGESSPPEDVDLQAHVAIDERSNQLLVTATPAGVEIARQAVAELDVPDEGEARDEVSGPYLDVYKVDDADLDQLSQTLKTMFPGLIVNRDRRVDLLHVITTANRHAEIAGLIRTMDGKGGGVVAEVIPLATLDAYTTAVTISAMFTSEGDDAPALQPDPSGRRLLFRGSSEQLLQVRTILAQLGEIGDGGGAAVTRSRGPVRRVPLGGRDPAEIARLLQQVWSAGNDEPLKIIDRSGAAETASPAAETDGGEAPADFGPQAGTTEGSPAGSRGREAATRRMRVRPAVDRGTASSRTVQDDGVVDGAGRPADTPSGGGGDVSVIVTEDGLSLVSRDEEKLDRLESILATLLGDSPGTSTVFSVFYLKASDAETTAATLREFFPPTIPPLSAPSGLAPAVEPLKIVAETRLNALFVTGPADQVRAVKELLSLLDSTDLPPTFRERVPRTIPVEYADVEEVAAVVKDVFADMLPQQRRGGEGRGDNETYTLPGQMTVGIDESTSQLVVSSDEAVFRQVEGLVRTLDDSAREARRTVRVVGLEYTDAATVSATLSALLPKVSVSSTGGGTRTSSSSTSRDGERRESNRDQSSENRGGPTDAQREAFRARMREIFAGRGGGPPGGGPPGGFGGGRGPGGGGRPGDTGGRGPRGR
ncbi:MAG: secretin N-terminal domain-containing protein [Planctomycetota bacterium]